MHACVIVQGCDLRWQEHIHSSGMNRDIPVYQALQNVSILIIKVSYSDDLLPSAFKPGGRLNIKMWSYQYRDSQVKDKTV